MWIGHSRCSWYWSCALRGYVYSVRFCLDEICGYRPEGYKRRGWRNDCRREFDYRNRPRTLGDRLFPLQILAASFKVAHYPLRVAAPLLDGEAENDKPTLPRAVNDSPQPDHWP